MVIFLPLFVQWRERLVYWSCESKKKEKLCTIHRDPLVINSTHIYWIPADKTFSSVREKVFVLKECTACLVLEGLK